MQKKWFWCLGLFWLMAHTHLLKTKRMLVFSKTKGYRHKSIEAGKSMFLQLGKQLQWAVDTTEDANVFTKLSKSYQVVVFLNTSGDVLDSTQQLGLQQYIRHGGLFLGIHAATDTEYDWPWYHDLIGAYFSGHPKQQNAMFHLVNQPFAATANLPDSMQLFEEIYNFKAVNHHKMNVVMTVDETSYQGGNMGVQHPICWWHHYDGGKMFYTALGHNAECYTNPQFVQLISNALGWLQR